MPKVSRRGSRRFRWRTTSAACRSPEASPATMASFMAAPRPPVAQLLSCSVAANTVAEQPSNRATQQPSSQRERVHHPAQCNAAEEQGAEHEQEKPDPLLAAVLPQQGEEERRSHGVEEHQHDVISQQAHSFRPSEISKTSRTRRRFISPAVIVNAVPCSYVIDVTSPCAPIAAATKYNSPAPIEPRL